MTNFTRSSIGVMLFVGIITLGAIAAPKTEAARYPGFVSRPGVPIRPLRPIRPFVPTRPMAPVQPMAPIAPDAPDFTPTAPAAPAAPAAPTAPYFSRPAAPIMPNIRNYFFFQNSPQRGYPPMFFQRY